jgi:hypothetical protein
VNHTFSIAAVRSCQPHVLARHLHDVVSAPFEDQKALVPRDGT